MRKTARLAGVSATYLSRIECEQEQTAPTEKTLAALARVLREDLDELLCLAGRVPEEVRVLLVSDVEWLRLLRRIGRMSLADRSAELARWRVRGS